MSDVMYLRRALGAFATGVTVVTTLDVAGQKLGVTANSFNSLSLDPPMVLWSLARSAFSLQSFVGADRFVVHVLADDQGRLSERFASRGRTSSPGSNMTPARKDCRFSGTAWLASTAGRPTPTPVVIT